MGARERSFAFFCVADRPAYVPKAITAMRSVQRFHPDATYVVVGRFGADDDAQEMISRHRLRFADLDLSDRFSATVPIKRRFRPSSWAAMWPSECYWWAGAPEMLHAMGFDHSCALDGDTLGVGPLALDEIADLGSTMAGVAKPNGKVNSGVLFFDHARVERFDLLAKATDVYRTAETCDHRECPGICRVFGDMALLHELERVAGLDVARIGNAYNHLLTWDERTYEERNTEAPLAVDESRILHLLSKPWNPPVRRVRLNPIMCDAYRAWWGFAREIWPDDVERANHFGRQRDLASHAVARLVRP